MQSVYPPRLCRHAGAVRTAAARAFQIQRDDAAPVACVPELLDRQRKIPVGPSGGTSSNRAAHPRPSHPTDPPASTKVARAESISLARAAALLKVRSPLTL